MANKTNFIEQLVTLITRDAWLVTFFATCGSKHVNKMLIFCYNEAAFSIKVSALENWCIIANKALSNDWAIFLFFVESYWDHFPS
jgi:hypothetical protein